jgi:hypothetical protein
MKGTTSEVIGLLLARSALWLTGNRELSRVASVLPLIRERRLAISSECLGEDPDHHPLLSQEAWFLWTRLGYWPVPHIANLSNCK